MPKTFIGGAVCRELKSEAPAAEENVRLCVMQQSSVQFSENIFLAGDICTCSYIVRTPRPKFLDKLYRLHACMMHPGEMLNPN